MTPPLNFLEDLRPAFVAHFAERLADAICKETQAFADSIGLVAPVRTHSALMFLLLRGPASLVEIAHSDGQSHQLVASRLAPLEQLGLIERFQDEADRRRRPYRLTPRGRAEAKRVQAALKAHADVQRQLAAESGVDLMATLQAAEAHVRRIQLSERIAAQHQPSKTGTAA
ncbi:MarR family winged helix-turn-helix transcriptional regulator [Ideonella sp. DXS29W]|uniref:MarR family winged helix-turn-helix transcriptional regulator n=1 Tax=Ideonella lacteola TaxID=2984193 RepID=A0ABU9BSB7_9BURK